MNLTHELESARAHWSQVYTKTKQIGRSLRSSRTKAVSISEMQELREPCARAKEPTLETFWCYLEGHRAEEKISLGDEPVPGVKITSVWLWVYFGHTLLSEQSQVLPSYLQDHHFTPQEQLEFYQRLSAYCLYALDEIRQEQQSPSLEDRDPFRPEVVGDVSPVEFVRSLIYLIAEYAHTDVALPRAFDLEKHLRDALSSDALLYSMAELYRDHVLHVVDVCLLGYFLLNCKVRGDQSLLALVSQGRCSREALLRNWFLASLFHDIGYGLEIYYRITDQLAFLEAPRLAKAKVRIDDCIDGALLRFCRKANKALAREEILSSPVGEVLDHGIVSYLHVKELLEAVPDGASAMDELESGLRAIAKHNLMREAISFEDEPVAFLLVLCDELQDWGRPRIESAELREAIVSKIIFSDRSTLKANRLLRSLFVSAELAKPHAVTSDGTIDFCLRYRDAARHEFEPLFIWLSKSYSLQRMTVAEEQVQITVAMRNPVSSELQAFESPDVCEMHILRDFMRDRRKWRTLEHWIDGGGVVVHELQDGVENVCLHLNALAGAKLMREHPRCVFDELFAWRSDYIMGKRRRL